MIDYKLIFEAVPCTVSILDLNLCFISATNSYLKEVCRSHEELVGKYLFDAFPASETRDHVLLHSLKHVITQKEAHFIPTMRYDILVDGIQTEKWWSVNNIPIILGGEVVYIVNQATDITELISLRAYHKRSLAELAKLTVSLTSPI